MLTDRTERTTHMPHSNDRPANMPRTAFQHGGIWYRNQRAFDESPAGRRLAEHQWTSFNVCANCGCDLHSDAANFPCKS